ncbi:MAG: PLP-dependent aminotransferase family protein [Acidobacteria bacterium]|nr:PLP-dependent aminotransferase family protein [Acidobacteriota bacterium]
MDVAALFSKDAEAFQPSAIRALAPLLNDSSVISFAAGVPNPETFPAEALREAADRVLRDLPKRALQYDVTRGYLPLRERVAARGAALGLAATGGETLLTTGSQQALDLAARVLFDPGDVVLVEVPTYVGALVTFAARRARPVGIVRTAEGIDLAHLRATVSRLRGEGERVKALYVIPNFQNPSGLAMTRAAKDALAEAVAELDLLLLEDDPYGELSFGNPESFDRTPVAVRQPGRTVYLGSFSKTLAAGFRVGWMHGPESFLSRAELAQQAVALCPSTFTASVLESYLAHNDYDAHLESLRGFYRTRKNVLLAALGEHFPKAIAYSDPAGGLFTWASLPAGMNAAALLPRCVAETKTAYVPGASFVVEGDGTPFFRMTYAKETAELLAEGARRLGAFFAREMESR